MLADIDRSLRGKIPDTLHVGIGPSGCAGAVALPAADVFGHGWLQGGAHGVDQSGGPIFLEVGVEQVSGQIDELPFDLRVFDEGAEQSGGPRGVDGRASGG